MFADTYKYRNNISLRKSAKRERELSRFQRQKFSILMKTPLKNKDRSRRVISISIYRRSRAFVNMFLSRDNAGRL